MLGQQFKNYMDAPAKKDSWTAVSGDPPQSRRTALAGRMLGAAMIAAPIAAVGGAAAGGYALVQHDNSTERTNPPAYQGPGSGNPVWSPKIPAPKAP